MANDRDIRILFSKRGGVVGIDAMPIGRVRILERGRRVKPDVEILD